MKIGLFTGQFSAALLNGSGRKSHQSLLFKKQMLLFCQFMSQAKVPFVIEKFGVVFATSIQPVNKKFLAEATP